MTNRGFVYRDQVAADGRDETVLEYLARRYRHSDRSAWRQRIQAGLVSVDEGPAQEDQRLRAGQVVAWRRPPWVEPPVPRGFAVLYRDHHCLGVAKPAGVPSVPAGGYLEHTLWARVRAFDPSAHPMHRHGRHTSGVTLYARTAPARRALQQSWRDGAVERDYRALVQGQPERDDFLVDQPIGPVPHPALGTVHAADPRGRPARSRVQVLERRPGAALVRVRIATGRPHQIRIHLAAAGHPLVGDPLYSAGGVVGDPRARPGDPGYHLHAARLVFPHPGHGGRVTVECAPPPLLRRTDHWTS